MNLKNWLAVILFSFPPLFYPFSAFSESGDLPMIGLDDSNEPVEFKVPAEEYSRNLTRILTSIDASTLTAVTQNETRTGWALRTVVVGIGLGVEVGIGPIIKLKAAPKVRLLYSNSKDAVVP